MVDMVLGRGIYAYWTKRQRALAALAFCGALSVAFWLSIVLGN